MLATAQSVEIDLTAFPPVSRDRKDDTFLATAKAGGRSYVGGEDDDLLVPAEYDRIRIVGVATFLQILDRLGAEPEPDCSG